MTLNLPSNKNKYVCLFPEALTALSWPRDLGRIDGPASLGSRVHLLLKVFPMMNGFLRNTKLLIVFTNNSFFTSR